MEREKSLATRVVVEPLPLLLAAGLGLDPSTGPSSPIPSPLDLALAPLVGDMAVRR